MYVYFIEAHCRPSVVKIGVSFDIKSRMRALQTSMPFRLQIIGFVVYPSEDEARLAEKKLHRKFKRRRMNGEWFRLSPKTREAIELLAGENRHVPPRIEPPFPHDLLPNFSLIEHRMGQRRDKLAKLSG